MITHWIARPIYPGDQELGIVMFAEPDEHGIPNYSTADTYEDIAESANFLIAERDRALALIAAIEELLDGPAWTHELDTADDGDHIYCVGREDVRALLEDYRNGVQP